jgi:hypothetical protein
LSGWESPMRLPSMAGLSTGEFDYPSSLPSTHGCFV